MTGPRALRVSRCKHLLGTGEFRAVPGDVRCCRVDEGGAQRTTGGAEVTVAVPKLPRRYRASCGIAAGTAGGTRDDVAVPTRLRRRRQRPGSAGTIVCRSPARGKRLSAILSRRSHTPLLCGHVNPLDLC